jgi:hypothetical protein
MNMAKKPSGIDANFHEFARFLTNTRIFERFFAQKATLSCRGQTGRPKKPSARSGRGGYAQLPGPSSRRGNIAALRSRNGKALAFFFHGLSSREPESATLEDALNKMSLMGCHRNFAISRNFRNFSVERSEKTAPEHDWKIGNFPTRSRNRACPVRACSRKVADFSEKNMR